MNSPKPVRANPVKHPNHPTLVEPAPSGHILVVEDPSGVRQFALDRGRYVLGRSEDCDIRLRSKFASRYHALLEQVVLEFGMVCYTITDGFLAKPSANGLLINGHKIPTKRLEDGDIVVFGPGIKFKYHNLSKQKIAPNPKGLNSLAPYETEVLQHNQNQGNAMQRDAVYRNILQRQALQHDVQYNAMPPQAVQCKAAF